MNNPDQSDRDERGRLVDGARCPILWSCPEGATIAG